MFSVLYKILTTGQFASLYRIFYFICIIFTVKTYIMLLALVKIRFLLALNASLLPDPYYLDILYSMYTNYMYVQQIGAALATL